MPRGRPRNFDKAEALDIALKLFWQHGYEGTSVAMLAEAIGVNVPSLYAAFGNKESLFLRCIERYGELNGKMYHESFKKKTAREVARSILEGEVELVTRRGTPDGCLMVQGALATSPESESIRKMMAGMRGMAEKWMVERFRHAIDDGDLPSDADPAALACYLMSLNSGLAVQAKSGVGKKQLLKVVDIAMRSWPEKG
ncbi:MAG TPA: TetR/AcrR family transcriptional regulator [Kiloniellales bacterium]